MRTLPGRLFLLALALLVFSVSGAAGQGSDPVLFQNDLTQIVIRGDDSDERDVSVTVGRDRLTIEPKKRGPASIVIAYASISSITYDRRSRVRRMAPTYGRRIQHFLTLQFKTDAGGDFVEIEMGKDVAPRLVAVLEARSGKTIARTGM